MSAKVQRLSKEDKTNEERKATEKEYRRKCKQLARKEVQEQIGRNKKRNIWSCIGRKREEAISLMDKNSTKIIETNMLVNIFGETFRERNTPKTLKDQTFQP